MDGIKLDGQKFYKRIDKIYNTWHNEVNSTHKI